jgi:hypothetical protein
MSKLTILLASAICAASVAGAPLKPDEVLIPVRVIVEKEPDHELWFRKAAIATAKIRSKEDCLSHGGDWKRMGMRGYFGCDLPTPDAGKSCTTDNDCAMICTPAGEQIARTGHCSPSFNMFGCLRGMKDGVSTAAICID